MNFALKAAFGMLVTLASFKAGAATLSCVDAKVKNGPVVLSYQIQNTKSARLGSDITYKNQVISSFQVAQYMAQGLEVYLLLDDALTNTTPILQFVGVPLIKSNFLGAITEYNSAGKATKTYAVKCKIQ